MTQAKLPSSFWIYRISQMISLIGDQVSIIAIGWWIIDTTGSEVTLSSILAPAIAVKLLLLPILGPFGDRFNKKKLLIIATIWRFIVILCLWVLVSKSGLIPVYITSLMCLASIGSALGIPVSKSMIPELVPQNLVGEAIRQGQIFFSVGQVSGMILGGVIVSYYGVSKAILIDALTFLVATSLLLLIKNSYSTTTSHQLEQSGERPSVWRFKHWLNDLTSGLRYFTAHPVIIWIGIAILGVNFVLSPMGIILPSLVKKNLSEDASALGYINSAFGLGMIIGSMILKRLERRNALMIGLLSVSCGVCLLGGHFALWSAILSIGLIGLGAALAGIVLETQLTKYPPSTILSRVMSIHTLLISIASPLGMILGSYLISSLGITTLTTSLSLLMLFILFALMSYQTGQTFIMSEDMSEFSRSE